MTSDTRFRSMTKDRLVRIESKLSRFVADNELHAQRVDRLCDRMETFLDEWDQFKREWDEEGVIDGEDGGADIGNVESLPARSGRG